MVELIVTPADPPLDHRPYRATARRAPSRRLLPPLRGATERAGPRVGRHPVDPGEADLTASPGDPPPGERIIVHGRVLGTDGVPVAGSLVEVWQAGASGRYHHPADGEPAPLDPDLPGVGRCLTDDEGRYRFVTVRPGAHPWDHHDNAWRPAHIHVSVFGPAFATRLVTQVYFPGDPLLEHDPIFGSLDDPEVAVRLIAALDVAAAVPHHALAYRWDVVVPALPGGAVLWGPTPSQPIGPFFHRCLPRAGDDELLPGGDGPVLVLAGRVTDGAGDPVTDALVELWQAGPDGTFSDEGFGRAATDGDGRYRFTTRRPGPVAEPGGGTSAPHLSVSLFAPGVLRRLTTRIYLADAEEANRADPLLAGLDDGVRSTLVTRLADDGTHHFDIRLQGPGETAFFAV